MSDSTLTLTPRSRVALAHRIPSVTWMPDKPTVPVIEAGESEASYNLSLAEEQPPDTIADDLRRFVALADRSCSLHASAVSAGDATTTPEVHAARRQQIIAIALDLRNRRLRSIDEPSEDDPDHELLEQMQFDDLPDDD